MTDNAERWRNVAQAAQWLAEGREVEWRATPQHAWSPLGRTAGLLISDEYRLKPEPPKPREWRIHLSRHSSWVVDGPVPEEGMVDLVRVREVIE